MPAVRATSSVVVPSYPVAPKTASAAAMICSRRSSELIRTAGTGFDVVVGPSFAFTLDMLSVDYYSRLSQVIIRLQQP